MRKAILVIACIIASTLAVGAPIGAGSDSTELRSEKHIDGVPFLENLRWGMSENDVRRAAPNIEEAFELRGPPGTQERYRELRLSRVMIGTCQFDARMHFFNPPFDELTSISATFMGENVQACIDSTRALLMHRFGTGRSNSAIAHGENLEWNGPVNSIIFMVFKVRDKTYLSVSLWHTGAPGTFVQ
jgi:hypothetical protein